MIYKSFITLIFLALINISLHSQNNKKTFDLESELDINNDDNSDEVKNGNIEQKEITIEAEEEKLLKNEKKKNKVILPEDKNSRNWGESKEKLIYKKKQNTKDSERQASIATEYGFYNSLGVQLYVSKKDKDGIYLLKYNREKIDAEGFNNKTVANSKNSLDDLSFTSGFKINSTYQTLFKAEYKDKFSGLQENSFYTEQFKRLGSVEIQNQFRPSEYQRLNITTKSAYSGSKLSKKLKTEETTSYFEGNGDIDWIYIWGKRNSINSGLNLQYAEQGLYFDNPTEYYRYGNFYFKDIFPLFDSSSSKDNLYWHVDVTIGAQVFFGQGFKPIIGPFFEFDNFLNFWHSKIRLERKGSIPDYKELFMNTDFNTPKFFSTPNDKWLAGFYNTIKFNSNMNLKLDGEYKHYNNYTNPYLNQFDLISYNQSRIRLFSAKLAFEHSITDNLFYDLGLKGNNFFDALSLESYASWFLRINYSTSKWDFSFELEGQGERNLDTLKLYAYTLANVSIERNLNKSVSLYLKGNNLFNYNYKLHPLMEKSGLKIYAGLRLVI